MAEMIIPLPPSEVDLARCAEVSRTIQETALAPQVTDSRAALNRIEALADLLANRLERMASDMLGGRHG